MARLPRGCAILSLIWRRTCNGAAGPFTRSESGFASARPWFHPRLKQRAFRPPASLVWINCAGNSRLRRCRWRWPALLTVIFHSLLTHPQNHDRFHTFCAAPLSLRAHARRTFQPTALIEDAQAIESLMTPIRSYLHMQSRTLEVPFDTRASAFCETVWGALRRIPYGQTRSYTEIAAAIGAPRAVRAVANACAKNPLALITPCHRVIQKNG